MSAEQYTGQLYLAKKTRPQAKTSGDGTFAVQMLAYSRPHAHDLVPWRIFYYGDAALTFWCHYGADLLPGAALDVALTRLQIIEGGGRQSAAEIHAEVVSLAIAPPTRAAVPGHAPLPCGIHADLSAY